MSGTTGETNQSQNWLGGRRLLFHTPLHHHHHARAENTHWILRRHRRRRGSEKTERKKKRVRDDNMKAEKPSRKEFVIHRENHHNLLCEVHSWNSFRLPTDSFVRSQQKKRLTEHVVKCELFGVGSLVGVFRLLRTPGRTKIGLELQGRSMTLQAACFSHHKRAQLWDFDTRLASVPSWSVLWCTYHRTYICRYIGGGRIYVCHSAQEWELIPRVGLFYDSRKLKSSCVLSQKWVWIVLRS